MGDICRMKKTFELNNNESTVPEDEDALQKDESWLHKLFSVRVFESFLSICSEMVSSTGR